MAKRANKANCAAGPVPQETPRTNRFGRSQCLCHLQSVLMNQAINYWPANFKMNFWIETRTSETSPGSSEPGGFEDPGHTGTTRGISNLHYFHYPMHPHKHRYKHLHQNPPSQGRKARRWILRLFCLLSGFQSTHKIHQ